MLLMLKEVHCFLFAISEHKSINNLIVSTLFLNEIYVHASNNLYITEMLSL